MKSLVVRLLPLFCLSMPVMAASTPISYEAVYRAELEAKAPVNYSGGSLSVDGRTGIVDISLFPVAPVCPEGMACIAMVPNPVDYSLEGAQSFENECGIIQTVAEFDQRPVDGIFLKVTISNNRNNTCPTLVALPALNVVVEKKYYNRIEGKEVSETDAFEAQDIAQIKPGPKGGNENVFDGQVLGASYKDKTLTLKLQYSGGCKEHAFDLNWGECKNVKLLNSTIEECNVTLIETQGTDDFCEALITKKHTIDLSGLGKAYILNLNGKRVLVH